MASIFIPSIVVKWNDCKFLKITKQADLVFLCMEFGKKVSNKIKVAIFWRLSDTVLRYFEAITQLFVILSLVWSSRNKKQ